MSQVITNVTTGKATTNTLWYGAGGKAEAGQGTGIPFDQKLISMLMGDAKSQEGQASMSLLALVGLTGLTEGAEAEGTEAGLHPVLENVLQDLPKLDEALQNDSALLSVVQGWLQSFQALLLEGNAGNAENKNQEAPALPALAQHSETIRFAVQDAVVQLLALNESAMGTENQHQVKMMLQTLQNLLDDLPAVTDAKASNLRASELTSLSTQAKVVVQPGTEASGQGNSGQHSEMLKNANPPVTILQQGQQSTDAAAAKFVQVAGTSTGSAEVLSDVQGGEQDTGLDTGNIVTAGQLALRDHGVAAPKHVAKPVPVENFGKEMSSFLVNKLEIVKLQGVSEARISLYPEHLGQVDVKITMQNGLLTAQFVTEHAFAKDSLEQQMSQLRAALQSQGLQVSRLEVTQNTALSSHMYHDGRQSGNGTGQQQAEKRRQLEEDDLLAIHDLNEEWNEWMAEVKAKEQDYGSSFVARA
ncbi:flagellar hook-length control protein FliK [Paenibacillus sanguinis]|uniref:flagellar hook-length control protein FliK n=1 Tax=Paenibacillus sanguinis TaxID=225906 RepID=UPI00037128FA|nr:flagellar hook-length control protein FliK [Paenibacillus sanguinis]